MTDLLDRDNKHLLLEKMNNSNNSFIANVNNLAKNLESIIQSNNLFSPEVIPVLQEIAGLNLHSLVEDLTKGTYLGNRKIDINLLYNLGSYDPSLTQEELEALWLDVVSLPKYDSATIIFKEGTSHTTTFTFDGNPITIATHADLLLQLNNDTVLLGKLNNTLISTFPTTITGEFIRFYDTTGSSSNIERIVLHVASGYAKDIAPAYFWGDTTSALGVMATRSTDLIRIGNEIDNIIQLANNINQLIELQARIPLVEEVSENIIPNLSTILQTPSLASAAQTYANNAASSMNAAATSAGVATAKANEIKSVSVENVITGVAGTPAQVIYSGVTGKFTFVIPQGARGEQGRNFNPDARGTFSQRTTYDAMPEGFSFLAIDLGEIYFREGAAGNWSAGAPFAKGDKGDAGDDGRGIVSVAFSSTTSPSGNPAQSGATDTYEVTYTEGASSFFDVYNGLDYTLPASTNKVYVSKQGSNFNDGLTLDKPKLTLTAAITVASTLLSAGATRVTVEIMDTGTYTEDIEVPQNVRLYGINATLEGTLIVNNNTYVWLYGHCAAASSTTMVTKKGNAHAYYRCVVQDARGVVGSLTGCTNIATNVTGSTFFVEIELQIINFKGISETTASGNGRIHVRIKNMYLMANNAIAISATGTESGVIGQVDRILPLGSFTGTVGVYCNTLSGNVDLRANEIIANTAYDIVKGDVRLNCAKVVGAKVGTPVLDLSRLAEAPSVDHPNGIRGMVVPDGNTIKIEDGLLKSQGGGVFPGQIVYSSMNTLPDGDKFIFIDGVGGQPGLLPRAAYQGFINNWLSRPENAALWVNDSVWQAEVATFGFTLKYSKGNGSTTWRPPFLQECFLGAAGVGRPMGSAQLDKIQNITGELGFSGTGQPIPTPQGSGAFTTGPNVSAARPAGGDTRSGARIVAFDASNEVRTGDRVEPRSVYGRVMLCVANANINVTEQNIQVLVDSLVHKLDSATYTANNTYSTSEVDTGKVWFDGRHIFRKMLSFGAMPNSTTKAVNHNISNLDLSLNGYIHLSGYAYNSGSSLTLFLPSLNTQLRMTSTQVIAATNADLSAYTVSRITMEYVKIS